MAQHDYVLDNQTGLNFRADLNAALLAIAGQNSGATAPATTYPYMLWADTASDRIKQRNAANNAWIEILVMSTGTPVYAVAKDSATGAASMPAGTTGERPTGAAGKFRFNSTLGKFEGHNGTSWGSVGGGATGGGTDDVFIENGNTVTTNYTFTTNHNAVSAGPITVNNGVSVTIPTGSRWVIV